MTRASAMFAVSLIWLAGCSAAPTDHVTWREAWEMLVCTSNGGLIDARLVVGNTGVVAGQGRLHLDRWRAGESPVNFARMAGPDESGVWEQRERVSVGPDRLGVERGGWTLRVNDEQAGAVLHLQPVDAPTVPSVSGGAPGGTWTVSAPIVAARASGWLEAGAQGGAVDGHGLMVYRSGTGLPDWPRRAVYIFGGGDTSFGLDVQGDSRLAWARVSGTDLVSTDASLTADADGALVLDLAPSEDVQVRLVPRATGGRTEPYDHLSWPESQALRVLGGAPVRRVTLLQARIQTPKGEQRAPAVLVEVAPPSDLLPIRAPKRLR
jgi:hypothetical protein